MERPTVVKFYVRALADGAVPRAWKELKGFQKQRKDLGKSEYVISFYDMELNFWRVLKGWYNVLMGFSAMEIVALSKFDVKEEFIGKGL
jgi:hypothetical protein